MRKIKGEPNAIRMGYNSPGHPREVTLHFTGFGNDEYIPSALCRELQTRLGEQYYVCDRGSRLEITSDLFPREGLPITELRLVRTAVRELSYSVLGWEDCEMFEQLTPAKPPVEALRSCPHCGEMLTFREILAHRRAAGVGDESAK